MTRLWRRVWEVVGLLLLPGFLSASLDEVYVDMEYSISAGHVMLLPCNGAEERERQGSVRVGGPPLDTITYLHLKNNTLWFLPAQVNHTGVYDCSEKYEYFVGLKVGSGPCPEADNKKVEDSGAYLRLDCNKTMKHITSVFPSSTVTWLKECKTLARGSIDGKTLHLEHVQPTDGGRYTCVLGFTHEDRNYTSARTTTLTVKEPIRRLKPQIIVPLNETRAVKIGSQEELRCEATVTPSDITTVHWKLNGTTIRNSSDFTVIKEYGKSVNTLTIIEVKTEFLNVPFTCLAMNSLGIAISTLVLTEANEGHTSWLVAGVCLCVLLVVGTLLWRFFKVDLVLLYRSLCPRQHRDIDGKLYDAYVSYPYESQGLSMTFALRILPEVLENKYNYKLFIRGRDDEPGQDVFDVVVNAIQKSRRLIIVLEGTHTATYTLTAKETDTPSQLNEKTHRSLSAQAATHSTQPVCLDMHTNPAAGVFGPSSDTVTVTDPLSDGWTFEQNLLVHDALLSSGLKVIVIQTGHREEHNLPASLGLLTHSKRVLRWHTHTRTRSQRRFWKELRYFMPVAPRPSPISTSNTTDS